jgi:hypothetical protein
VTTLRGTNGALSRRVHRPVGVAEAVAEHRLVPVELADDRLGVGVEQQLVRVAAQPAGRVVGAVDAVAVALPGPTSGQVAVPHEAGDLGQVDAGLVPVSSNRHSSTRSATSENIEKLVPRRRRWRRAGRESLHWMRATRTFEFIRSQIVIFDTRHSIRSPEQLAEVIPQLSTGSVFYHFIDARRRVPDHLDDFREWFSGFGERYAGLRDQLAGVEPYFSSMTEIRERLTRALELAPAGESP